MTDKITKMMNEKLNQGREYRDLTLDADDDDTFAVQGYATTFNQMYHLYDLDENTSIYEQVDRSAFDDTDLSDVIFQYNHEGRVFARLSNDTMALDKDEHGLKVLALLGGTSIGRELYEEIKGGYTNKMSFGFIVGDDDVSILEESENNIKYLRTIKQIRKVFDVSAVSLPANDYTEISARRSLDGVIKGLETERFEKRLLAEQRKKEIERLKLQIQLFQGTR